VDFIYLLALVCFPVPHEWLPPLHPQLERVFIAGSLAERSLRSQAVRLPGFIKARLGAEIIFAAKLPHPGQGIGF
jgi:hypothetical protein